MINWFSIHTLNFTSFPSICCLYELLKSLFFNLRRPRLVFPQIFAISIFAQPWLSRLTKFEKCLWSKMFCCSSSCSPSMVLLKSLWNEICFFSAFTKISGFPKKFEIFNWSLLASFSEIGSLLSAFFLQQQVAVLREFEFYMENTIFGANKFQKGAIITVNSLIGLQKYMNEKYGIKYLMCSHVDQDYLESFNGTLRLADGRGGVRRPTYLQLNYRLQRKF